MKPSEAAALLALAATIDKRTVGEFDAIAWADVLHGLQFTECAEAVRRHRRESTEYLQPAHVRRWAGIARRERAEAARNEQTLAEVRSIAARTHVLGDERRAQIQAIRRSSQLPAGGGAA